MSKLEAYTTDLLKFLTENDSDIILNYYFYIFNPLDNHAGIYNKNRYSTRNLKNDIENSLITMGFDYSDIKVASTLIFSHLSKFQLNPPFWRDVFPESKRDTPAQTHYGIQDDIIRVFSDNTISSKLMNFRLDLIEKLNSNEKSVIKKIIFSNYIDFRDRDSSINTSLEQTMISLLSQEGEYDVIKILTSTGLKMSQSKTNWYRLYLWERFIQIRYEGKNFLEYIWNILSSHQTIDYVIKFNRKQINQGLKKISRYYSKSGLARQSIGKELSNKEMQRFSEFLWHEKSAYSWKIVYIPIQRKIL